MQLKVLGSSSKGNCYLLDNGNECLVIEAGVSFSEVQKAVNFDIGRIVGMIVTHEHIDHAKHLNKFIEARIPVYMSNGTRNAVKVSEGNRRQIRTIGETYGAQPIGRFMVSGFWVNHDAAMPYGYVIEHPEMGRMVFATDTKDLPYSFPGVNHFVIECNYDRKKLEENIKSGRIDPARAKRIKDFHMSFSQCMHELSYSDLSSVRNIVLIHLSNDNADSERFRDAIIGVTGKNTTVAAPGVCIDVNKQPF